MQAIFQDQPLPARLVPWPRTVPTTLARCGLLALLLHAWVLVWLGNAPGGTAPLGQGVWGAINVTLRGPIREGAAPTEPPLPANPMPGPAATARWGGAVRQTEALPAPQPGAARLGVPVPAVLPAPATEVTAVPPRWPEVVQAPEAPEAPEAPAQPLPSEPRLSRPAWSAPAAPAEPLVADRPLPAPAPSSSPALPAVPAPAAVLAAPPRERTVALPLMQVPPSPPPAGPAAALPRMTPMAEVPELGSPPALARMPGSPVPAEAPRVPTPPAAGAADADVQLGHDIATPAGAAASAPPRLNLQLARPRGGELSRGATAGMLPLLPRPPERDDKLAKDIEKAGRPDCSKAYPGAGLLAVIPLAADALRKNGGCKW